MIDSASPMVTVVVPCFNHAHFLRYAYASMLTQSITSWEAIVVDDGSTDNTRDVATSFGDSRVRYIHQTNQGLSAARNTGIAVATGRYICFLDADDEWEPEFLGRAVALLDGDTRQGGVYGLSRFIDERGNYLPEGGSSPVPDEQFHERLLYGCFLPVHSALLRREAVLGTGGFDTDLTSVEDWDFWIRLSGDWRMKAIAEPLVRYRVVSGSMSMDASRMLKNRIRVFEKHLGDLIGSDSTAWDERARRAYARILVSAATDFAHQNLVSQSWDFLAQAAQLEPAVLDRVDTLFGMACAKQPRGYRGTAHFIDPRQVETELLTGVEGLFSGEKALPKQLHMSALGSAHLALLTLNDRIGEWGVARRHLLTALRYRHSLIGDPRHLRTLLRLYIGPRSTKLLRRLWFGPTRAHGEE